MYVSALEAGHLSVPLDLILAGEEPDEPMVCPSLPFFLRHSKRDSQQHKRVCACCNRNVLACRKADKPGGVRPSSVDMVALSHIHWDQSEILLHSPQPSVLREGSEKALAGPGSCYHPAAFASVRVPEDRPRFITVSDLHTTIGPYLRAMDISSW